MRRRAIMWGVVAVCRMCGARHLLALSIILSSACIAGFAARLPQGGESGGVPGMGHAGRQEIADSSLVGMDGMLAAYVSAMEGLRREDKSAECDFIISSCVDDSLRAHVAGWLLRHYSDSRVMGEESVAVDIYDRWVVGGKVSLPESDRNMAEVFVMFNRESLVGERAPVMTMETMDGQEVEIPGTGDRQRILYFYDTDCAKCRVESILLNAWLSEVQMPLSVFAIYVGSDREAWQAYVSGNFTFSNDNVGIYHCWDPDMDSDFVRHYAVLGTPRLFVVDGSGVIQGRRLDVEAMKQVTALGEIRRELRARAPEGSRIADITVWGEEVRGGVGVKGAYRLRHLGGRRNYIIFHTPGCDRCKEQLAAARALAGRRDRVLLIDMDELVVRDPSLASELFDSFDLSVMPHVLLTDRRGRILGKYLDLTR